MTAELADGDKKGKGGNLSSKKRRREVPGGVGVGEKWVEGNSQGLVETVCKILEHRCG